MEFIHVSFILGLMFSVCYGNDESGLTYLDDISGNIVDSGAVVTSAAAGNRGKIVVDSGSVYYYVVDNTVRELVTPPGSTVPIDVPGIILDLAVCCGRVLVLLSQGNQRYAIAVSSESYTKILLTFTNSVCAPRMAISCNNRIIYYTTDNGVFQWDFTDINFNVNTELGNIGGDNFMVNMAYGGCPVCLEYTEDNGNPLLYFTVESSNTIYQIDDTGTFGVFQMISDRDAVFYLAADSTCLYFSSIQGTTHRVEYRLRESPAGASTLVSDTVRVTGLSTCQNGICDQSCPATGTCSTCANGCGSCLPGAGATHGSCFCSNVFQDTCAFSPNAEFDANCEVGLAPNDLICAVVNPITGRRPPASDISLHGIVAGTVVPEFPTATYDTQIIRRVKTGNWPMLPDYTLRMQYGDDQRKGLVFRARWKSRGQRYGVFASQLQQTNGLNVGSVLTEALCITQEGSKLFSPYYTVTTSVTSLGQPNTVTLRAYVPIPRRSRLRWSVTDVATGRRTELLNGVGRHFLTFNAEVGNAGIYEVYVEPRYLRTWHAIFHVIVRGCDEFNFGADCSRTCPSCTANRGVCDEASGTCICLPGYTGVDCADTCPAGMIGRDCSISCETEFGQTGCQNTLICSPEPVGCHCFQEASSLGLQPPDCACPTNTWGRRCENTCDCIAGEICDSMNGCIVDYIS